MSYLILGASSGLGRELANILAQNSNDLIIISRDEKDLKAIKFDLETKFKVVVKYFAVDVSLYDEVKKFLDSNFQFWSFCDLWFHSHSSQKCKSWDTTE